MSTMGPPGVGEMQTATALMLAVETGPQRRTERDHTCDAREELRKGAEPVWIGDDLGRLEQRESGPTRMATWNVGGGSWHAKR